MNKILKIGLLAVASGMILIVLTGIAGRILSAIANDTFEPMTFPLVLTAILLFVALPLVGFGSMMALFGLIYSRIKPVVRKAPAINDPNPLRPATVLYSGAVASSVVAIMHLVWSENAIELLSGTVVYWMFAWLELVGVFGGFLAIALAVMGTSYARTEREKLVGLVLIIAGGCLQALQFL